MRIIIIGPSHPYRGGIAALNDRLAVELTKLGHKTTIAGFSLQYPSILFPGKTQFTDSPKPDELEVVRLINSVNPFSWLWAAKKIKALKPDLVLVRYWLPFMGPSTGTVCRLVRNKHTKVIAITDNIIPHEKRFGDKIFTHYFSGGVDGFLAMSDCVYHELDQFRKNKPKALSPHPIYDHYGEILERGEALKQLGLDSKYKYVLFFGFIREYKGLDLLLQAIALLKTKQPDIKLIVAGEFYSNEEHYLTMISDMGLKEQVILRTDYIPDNEVNRYFCAADIVAQPYKTATQSGVTQVGYHFNKAMLVTNVGGLSEIIDHEKGGYVVNTTGNDIATALDDFFANNKKEAMEAHVIKAKERFSWSFFCKSIFQIYEAIKI